MFNYQLVGEGQPLTVECIATGSPIPTLSWLLDGKPLVSFVYYQHINNFVTRSRTVRCSFKAQRIQGFPFLILWNLVIPRNFTGGGGSYLRTLTLVMDKVRDMCSPSLWVLECRPKNEVGLWKKSNTNHLKVLTCYFWKTMIGKHRALSPRDEVSFV